MSRLLPQDKIQPHWWRKSFIAFFLGLTLSYGLVALFAWFGPHGINTGMKVQFNMWILSLFWLPIIGFSYMFKTAKSALFYLVGANGITYLIFGLLWWLK